MEWAEGGALTWSAWIKPTTLAPNAVIFSRREENQSFIIGLNNGAPYVQIGQQQSAAGTPISVGVWHHLSVMASGTTTTVYLDGKSYGTVPAGLPALKGPSLLGKDSSPEAKTVAGFTGEIDELHIAKAARSVGYLRFAAINQGTASEAGKLLVAGADEASAAESGGELAKQAMLIKDISKDLTLDGWVVIVLCGLLAVIGWCVAIAKLMYLNKINKATNEFLKRWEKVSSDLTALDQSDEESIKSLGGTVNAKGMKLMRHSPMYHIYRLGSDEIRQRLQTVRGISLGSTPRNAQGLSGRAIQAIKASLHSGLMREVQKLNSKLVFLTIGIAGGPYLGPAGHCHRCDDHLRGHREVWSGGSELHRAGYCRSLAGHSRGPCRRHSRSLCLQLSEFPDQGRGDDMETFIDEFIAKMAEHHKEAGN